MRWWRPRLFCVLDEPQQRQASAELARICNPDGEIRVLEYALSSDPVRRFVMHLWVAWVRFAYAAAFDRNTALRICPHMLARARCLDAAPGVQYTLAPWSAAIGTDSPILGV